MTDTRDPHGIVNFFVRYLVLHVIFLVGLPVSYAMDLALIYFFGFLGFFTFFQMLIAITRRFLEKAGSWKIVAIVGPCCPTWQSYGGWDGCWEAHLTALLTGGL